MRGGPLGVFRAATFCIILQAILADRCGSPFCFVLANLCGFLLGKYFMMSSRSTRNSQSSALDALSIAVLAESSCASVIADLAANPPGPSAAAPRAVAAVVVQQDQPSPAFLATVVQAVKDALAADRAPARSVPSGTQFTAFDCNHAWGRSRFFGQSCFPSLGLFDLWHGHFTHLCELSVPR